MIGNFSPVAFWAVCAFAAFVTVGWFFSYWFMRRQRALIRQIQVEEETKRETPEQRQAKLLQAFDRHQVRMVVKESDITQDNDTSSITDSESTSSDSSCTEENNNDLDLEMGAPANDIYMETDTVNDNEMSSAADIESTSSDSSCTEESDNSDLDLEMGAPADGNDNVDDALDEFEAEGYLTLPCHQQVPNCCAVCLSSYSAGDTVIWSSNKACKHAFHEDCILDWLTKIQNGTPCPCCRQEFTELDETSEGTGKSLEEQ